MPTPFFDDRMNRSAEQFTQVDRPATTSRAQELLLDFLREHEAPCPLCGYNLKALVRPVCPECGQELVLTVGAARVRLGWLMTAVAPGFFSGIAAVFLLVPIVARLIFGDGRMSWPLLPVDLFGWCSGVFAIVLAVKRHRFLALSRAGQRWWAVGIWLVHVAALGLLILIGFVYL
jgi:hypothetical protein